MRALADAVGLYTRDLRLSLRTVPDDVGPPTPILIERIAATLRARR